MRNDVLITGGHGFIGRRIHGGKRYSGRVEDYDELAKNMKGMSGIVHLAAKSNWRECDEDPEDCIETNLFGLINVLDAAVFRGCWVIFISTFQYKENTLYGMSKLMGEEICRLYAKNYGLKIKILRLPVVYGPGDKAYKIVNRLISQIKAGKDPKITLNKRLQFVFVEDMARIIEREVDVMSGVFGKKISIRSLAEGIRRCLR